MSAVDSVLKARFLIDAEADDSPPPSPTIQSRKRRRLADDNEPDEANTNISDHTSEQDVDNANTNPANHATEEEFSDVPIQVNKNYVAFAKSFGAKKRLCVRLQNDLNEFVHVRHELLFISPLMLK